MKNKRYIGRHKPTGEEWVILGINEEKNQVCAAGYPPTQAKLSDIEGLKEFGPPLTEKELSYRERQFGKDWD